MITNKHKDRLFNFLFGREENKDWTLSLYNAVNHTDYTDSSEIEIMTIEDVVYMKMKNDISFLLHCYLNLYEQQSTFNPNMPLRELMYVGKLYDKYIHKHRLNIYGTKLISIPVPKLMVFYNGATDADDMMILRLSDAFPDTADGSESDIEVKVTMLNINHGHNRELMAACRPLAEYAWFIAEIRQNRKKSDIEAAVDKAIDDMPGDYLIRDFLIGHRAEVKDMCITEYNEAETMQMLKEEAHEEGRIEGHRTGLIEGSIKMIIELGREDGLDDAAILRRIQKKTGLPSDEAAACLRRYGGQAIR